MKNLLHHLAEFCHPEPEVLEPDLMAERREKLRRIAGMTYAERRAGAARLVRQIAADYPLIVSIEGERFQDGLIPPGLPTRDHFLGSLWASLMNQYKTARVIDWLARRYELDGVTTGPGRGRGRRKRKA